MDAVSKTQRASIFAAWLVDTYGVDYLSSGTGVLDVAGGRGEVTFELLERGVVCTLVEPRLWEASKLSRRQRGVLKARGVRPADFSIPQLQCCFDADAWDAHPQVGDSFLQVPDSTCTYQCVSLSCMYPIV